MRTPAGLGQAVQDRQREGGGRVVVEPGGELDRLLPARLGERGDGVDDVGGLVRPTAAWLRGEIGAVGLGEDPADESGERQRRARVAAARATFGPAAVVRPDVDAREDDLAVAGPERPADIGEHDVRPRRGQRREGRLGGVRLADMLHVVVLGEPERHEARERLRVIAVEDADSH